VSKKRAVTPGLGDTEKQMLNFALGKISDSIPTVQRLEVCGVNCDEDRATLAALEQRLMTIRQQFFPE
jgi:hypothetical protein